MVVCAVAWCKKKQDTKPRKLHDFPANVNVRDQWIKMCSREDGWVPGKRNKVCSRHFKSDDYTATGRLKKYAVPCVPGMSFTF